MKDLNPFLFRTLLLLVMTAISGGCATPPPTPSTTPAPPQKAVPPQNISKIKFNLDDIHPDGLRGPPDGLKSMSFEFCIPADERIYQEVRKIDPKIQIAPGSRGRIGCGKDQALCLGDTHHPRWREVLNELSALTYVTEIRECFFE